MRVGVYTECLSRQYTGVEVYTHSLVEGLGKTKNEITCFHSKSLSHPFFKNVRHHEFRSAPPIPFYHRFAALFHNSCFNNLDVLHLPLPQFPYVKKPKVPVVVTVHDLIPVFMPQYHNWKRVLHFKKFLPWYLRKVDAIIAVSNSTKSDLVRYYDIPEAKIHVVHESLQPVEGDKVSKEPFILYVGTLEPRKNIEGLLEAFAILKSRGFSHKLVIAGGKGWKYQGIFRTVSRLHLDSDVVFAGYVSDAEKCSLMRKAELFVYPSFYEGFGLPVLEAMALGTPVVTSNTSSLPEIVGDAGILVDPYDVGSIANGIERALSSSKSLINKGLKRAKLFTEERMMKNISDVYEGVV